MQKIHPHGIVLSPTTMFLDSGHLEMLAVYQVLFIYIVSLHYVHHEHFRDVELRPRKMKSMVELG